MAGNRELLAKRKDELTRMDNRIHELQMRLKKKRAMNAEMVERNKNQLNKSNLNNKMVNNKPAPNVAAVEPYIQEPPSNNNNNGFAKQDPKYQSLPPSSKFMYPDKNNRQRETNNNNVNYGTKQYELEKTDEYSIPLVVSVDSTNRPAQNGLPVSPKHSPVNPPAATQPVQPLPSSSSLQVPQTVTTSTSSNNARFTPSATPARSGVSHFTPKPYGSTYSSSIVPNRGLGGVPNDHPQYDVQDEIRQSGSGQSSPGSVEGVNSGNTKALPPYPQREMHEQNRNQQKDGQGKGPVTEVQPSVRGQQKDAAGKPPPPPVPNRGGNVPPNSLGQPLNTSKPQQNSASANSSENSSDNEQTTMSVSKGIQKFTGLIAQNSTDGQKSGGGFSNLNHASALGAVRSAPTYRYASKKDIANTYLGRFDNEALEKYQKKVANLHRDLNTSSSGDSPPELSPSAGQAEKLKDEEKDSLSPLSNHSSPLSSASTPSPASPTRSPNYPFDFPASPPHADVASDKVSFKPHTPKNVRRRHSDSDNEEVNKALNKYGINTTTNKSLPVQENQLRELENNKGVVEIQATAFNDRVPETVLLDNKGNIVEVVEPSKDNTKPNTDDNTNKLPTVTIEVKSSESKIKKKSNLKSTNGKKSGNRVSFDPLALLLDASLEGELDLVRRCAHQVSIEHCFEY